MTDKVISLKLGLCLALLSAGPAFTQTPEAVPDTTAAAPVAYVYVQTTKGVNLYDAAADGKLTLVEGSPFRTAGEMIGSNGKYFIALGTYDVHSYAVEANGAIGQLVSTVGSLDYDGAQCGKIEGANGVGTHGAFFDHAGQNVYVLLDSQCTALQTFNIAMASGDLRFHGAAITGGNAGSGLSGLPSIIGNDTFAYAAVDFGCCGSPPGWAGFLRNVNGRIENLTFNLGFGSGLNDPFGYVPYLVTADPTNHLAAVVSYNTGESEYGSPQLASYTVDSKGDLSTTSTRKNMPYSKIYPTSLNISPSGKLLAVAGWSNDGDDTPPGLQIFHFNAAEPVTPYSDVLTRSVIYQIQWDYNNHLYALGGQGLYVYTITPTSISEAPGSPYPIQIQANQICIQGAPESCKNGLVVVPRP
jgi:hypothetical protein